MLSVATSRLAGLINVAKSLSDQRRYVGIVQTIVRDLSGFPVLHKAKLPQSAKRVRHRRLGGPKNYRDVTYAELPACQRGYDPQARRIP